ncbi:hypothetical protein P9X77_13515 [Bacillus cereus]|uniref:hypothetical protein n=1 Tax=Bacillus cereus group TaxID=86661 RepID=UPI0002791578|nr:MULTISPECIES: hypothetical protein [Bacillus cereus group]EJQ01698.1 hypothetical protein IE1_05540 [Bacillus cereus BAG3O-2]MEC2973544.1 hypothetical protein [Bacillus cereus]
MNSLSIIPIIFLGSLALFIFLAIIVNLIFAILEKELPDELKIMLPAMLTCLIVIGILQFIK